MKVVMCHNYYQQAGGEDTSHRQEVDLLENNGHCVVHYTRHNRDLDEMGRLAAARRTFWNGQTYDDLREVIRRERPDVMHCTNTFPLISPAAYWAAKDSGTAVVQSLRNYRLLCPNALFMRNGRVCEDCLGRSVPWPAVVHGCYRGDRMASCVVAGMLSWHRWQRTWTEAVDKYYALTEFARAKFIEGGLPGDKITVKPNFLNPDPGPGDGRGNYMVFVGRLSEEKGLSTLLDAWSLLQEDIQLKIVGDGPLAGQVQSAAVHDSRICWLGRLSPDAVTDVVGQSTCLLLPSVCYEGFPRTILEAFAKGTPVIASRLGSMIEIVQPGHTGWHFDPGNAQDLSEKVSACVADRDRLPNMRQAARAEFEEKYVAERNYPALMQIYEDAMANSAADSTAVERTHTPRPISQ